MKIATWNVNSVKARLDTVRSWLAEAGPCTEDDLVDRRTQTDAFLMRLKQANFFVRTCIVQGAPHYWLSDPIEEPRSYSGFLAPRLVRFLKERL